MEAQRKLNLGQIASQAQVPITSVWKVIFGQGATIASNEFMRIKSVLSELDAVALSTSMTQAHLLNIGVIVPRGHADPVNDFQGMVLEALVQAVDPQQFMLVLHFYETSTVTALDFIQYIDGLIEIAGVSFEPVAQCEALGRPYVLVETGVRTVNERGALILIDNFKSTQTLVEHLIRLGHRKIATVTGSLGHASAEERLAGYQAALQQAQLPQNPEWVVEGTWVEHTAYNAAKRLLALPDAPTAIVAANDMMALGVVRAVREAGLEVGRDVSVTGFDDVPIASESFLELTTMRQPLQQMGSMAIITLAKLLNGEKLDQSEVRLPAELVVRKSTGQPVTN